MVQVNGGLRNCDTFYDHAIAASHCLVLGLAQSRSTGGKEAPSVSSIRALFQSYTTLTSCFGVGCRYVHESTMYGMARRGLPDPNDRLCKVFPFLQ